MQERGNYLASFEQFEKQAAGHDSPWLRKLRQEGFARFTEQGFPTLRNEDWRFTSTAAIAGTDFQLPRNGKSRVATADLERFLIPGTACVLVFVNGHFAAELSRLPEVPGVKIASLAEAIAARPGEVEAHLARYADYRQDAFSALNAAFLGDGAWVEIGRGAVVKAPIQILYVATGGEKPAMIYPRNLVVAGENSEAQIVEDYVSLGSAGAAAVFSNAVTELAAGENSTISHIMLEREDIRSYNVSTLRIQQARSSNVGSHSILLGGALVRNNVHPVLAGEGAECLVNGLFVGAGQQHLDNYMKVEHASPHCGSRQFYNGILAGRARGVFHGRIIVHKPAQKTDAKQTNRNLLLSDEAQIDTKPQLEIYADDVKCTHGATIGQIDEEQLFYLRSRGLAAEQARSLLVYAFANESLGRVPEGPARVYLEGLVGEWLPQATR